MNVQTSRPNGDTGENSKATCATSMAFNFTIGAIAILVAMIIGYIVYAYLTNG